MDTSLVETVTSGDLSSLKSLVSSQDIIPSDFINTPVDGEGTTLLHLAANSTTEILYYLLDNDATVSSQTEDGLTPLHIAAMWGREELVVGLLNYGADPLISDNEGLLPIDYAKNEGNDNCVQLLDSMDPYNDTTVMYEYNDEQTNDMSVAESFVAMFETFTIHSDDTLLEQEAYPDLIEHTLQTTSDDSYILPSPPDRLSPSLPSHNLDTTSLPATASPQAPTPASPAIPGSQTVHLQHPSAQASPCTPPRDVNNPNNTCLMSESLVNCSFVGEIQTSIPKDIRKLKDSELHDRLVSLDEEPGPITDSTRKAYMVYLTKLESGVTSKVNTGYKGFKYELALVLNGIAPIPNLRHLEEEIVRDFSSPLTACLGATPPRTPGSRTLGNRTPVRDNFNYLLLDPRVLQGSITIEGGPTDISQFRKFMDAVFYVGKGKNSRPIQHLKDAKTFLEKGGDKVNSKLSRIADIWQDGCGVVSLPLFYNTLDGEAFTRECCMIDTIGLTNLTNKVKGHVHGIVRQWPMSKRRQFGVYLLHKAFQVYLLTPPPQIRKHEL